MARAEISCSGREFVDRVHALKQDSSLTDLESSVAARIGLEFARFSEEKLLEDEAVWFQCDLSSNGAIAATLTIDQKEDA
jgi:hypothetical protein